VLFLFQMGKFNYVCVDDHFNSPGWMDLTVKNT